ncbi:hypothetical protein ACRRTK_001942 [Alexandromys fortis]
MAVDLGDQASGFSHSEVVRFINNEILMNRGGPEFYMAFRMQPWNEIEDQLCTILVDPLVPRSLKRACTWSALALSVRVGARQREQQAYMVGLPQDSLGQGPSAPWASVSELWQLRQQQEEAITQLISTQAALQQARRECDILRRRLYHERFAQVTPLVPDVVPGAQTQQLGASVMPMNSDHARVMGAMGGYTDRQYLEAQVSAATNVFYMPGSTSPWPTAMQPSVPVPMPYQFPPHPPFLVESPFFVPFSPPVVTETEGGAVFPVQMPLPPVYPTNPYAAPGSQDPTGLWDQRCFMATELPPVIQHCVPPEDIRNFSQEGDPEKTWETDIMGDNEGHIEGQDARRTQERGTLVDIENDYEEGEENNEEKDEEATMPEGELYSQSEKSPQASALPPLGSSKNQIKEGVKEAQSTPVWESWSQAVRESPKKQQPALLKKDKKPQVEAASQPQPVSGSGMNWICPKCKFLNYSWRKICFKCRSKTMGKDKELVKTHEVGGRCDDRDPVPRAILLSSSIKPSSKILIENGSTFPVLAFSRRV